MRSGFFKEALEFNVNNSLTYYFTFFATDVVQVQVPISLH